MDLVGGLRVFVAVADGEHVGRAAERLGLAQPVVSRQLQSLERGLAVDLFRRTGRRVLLSDDGRRLLPLARELVEQADRILEFSAQLGSERHTVLRLAVPALGDVTVLAAAIRLAGDHDLTLTLVEGADPDRRRRLAEARVDRALLRVEADQADFRVALGFGLARDDEPLDRSTPGEPVRPLHLESLRGRSRRPGPAILVQPEDAEGAWLEAITRAAGRAGLTPDQVRPVEAESVASAQALAGRGLLLCTRTEAARFGLRWRPSAERPARCYAVAGSSSATLPDGVLALVRRAFGGRIRNENRGEASRTSSVPEALFG